MTESQGVALLFFIVLAYYIVSRWRELVFLLAVIVLSVFGFGMFMLAQMFNGEPPTQGGQVVRTETTSHPR
ncbi:hypothetical protein AB0L64_16095 [Kribbella sp. NPDC051936]|uniref:hypothetical protein n=1 Tax=Kribbella sp. NPDC051936 TaxID=3154946 RepID=UPI003437E2E4